MPNGGKKLRAKGFAVLWHEQCGKPGLLVTEKACYHIDGGGFEKADWLHCDSCGDKIAFDWEQVKPYCVRAAVHIARWKASR
jgi:hypothetical protein